MHSQPEPPPRNTVMVGDEEVDEQLALFVADIRSETNIDLLWAKVHEPAPGRPGVPSAEFVFDDSEQASHMLTMFGELWPEQRGKLTGTEKDPEDAWGFFPILFDEDEECECGSWHVLIGMVVSIPLSAVDEFSRRLYREAHPESQALDLEQLFDTDTE